jgi:hypothetical protein
LQDIFKKIPKLEREGKQASSFIEKTFTICCQEKKKEDRLATSTRASKKQIEKLVRALKVKQKFLDLHKIEDETISGYKNTIKPLKCELAMQSL